MMSKILLITFDEFSLLATQNFFSDTFFHKPIKLVPSVVHLKFKILYFIPLETGHRVTDSFTINCHYCYHIHFEPPLGNSTVLVSNGIHFKL